MKRLIPFSQEKENRRCVVLYCKMRIRELKGGIVYSDLKEKRKERAEMTEDVSNTQEAEEMLKCAKQSQTELIEKGKEFREK